MSVRILLPSLTAFGIVSLGSACSAATDTQCYELRIYHAAPGKLDDLHQRFRNHTLRLFDKHGIRNVGYWVPINNNDDTRLIYLLAYPNREARETSWKAFIADPQWQAAFRASETNGPLVQKLENYFLNATAYSPEIRPTISEKPRVFELRDYTASTGNLDRLHARFRDHTIALFSQHGMHHFGYWTPMQAEPGSDNRLLYILWHDSTDAAKASFDAFRQDPKW